jgi:hypothetical protein
MTTTFKSVQKLAAEVSRRAERLRVKLSQSEDGWTLEGLPFTMAQLGYPNLDDSDSPGQVRSLSLKEADHFLYLCEKRVRSAQQSDSRFSGSFLLA